MTSLESGQSFSIKASVAEKIDQWSPRICQVCKDQDSNLGGTGLLVARGLILTCAHIIPSKESAKSSHVLFGDEKVELDPEAFFCTSPSPGRKIVSTMLELDYTVVALKGENLPEEVLKIIESANLVFDSNRIGAFVRYMEGISMIHYPKIHGKKKEKIIGRGVLTIKHRDQFNSYHTISTEGGSSGAVIFNDSGQILGMHRGKSGEYTHEKIRYATAVSMEVIQCDLKSQTLLEKIKEVSSAFLRPYRKESIISKLQSLYLTHSSISLFTIKKQGEAEMRMPMDSLYTQLAVIGEEEENKPNVESFDIQTPAAAAIDDGRLRNYETIFKAKKKVGLKGIFSQKKLCDAAKKRAVISGSGGIGKSTLVSYILRKWGEGGLWPNFEAVFCIRLRNLGDRFYRDQKEEYGAAFILQREYRGLCLDFEAILEDRDLLSKSLLIVDGFDEAPEEIDTPGEFLFTAFEEFKEKFPHILVTSRPGSVGIDCVSEFEILGFSGEQVKEYVLKFLQIVDKKASTNLAEERSKELLSYLNGNELAFSLCRIPINSSMICSLFVHEPSLFGEEVALTTTALYERVITHFYKVFLSKKGVSYRVVQNTKNPELDSSIKPFATLLKRIAFQSMKRGEANTDQEEIEGILSEENLKMDDFQKLGVFKIENDRGCFIHETFREFFSAKFIADLYLKDRSYAQKIVKKYKFEPRFALVWQMVAGYFSVKGKKNQLQDFLNDLFSKPKDFAVRNELNLLARCFEECGDPVQVEQYEKFIEVALSYAEKMFQKPEIVAELLIGSPKILKRSEFTEWMKEMLSNDLEKALAILSNVAQVRRCITQELVSELVKIFKDSKKAETIRWKALSTVNHVLVFLGSFTRELKEEFVRILEDDKADLKAKRYAGMLLSESVSGTFFSEKAMKALSNNLKDYKTHSDTIFAGEFKEIKILGEIAKINNGCSKQALCILTQELKNCNSHEFIRRVKSTLEEIVDANSSLREYVGQNLINILKDAGTNESVKDAMFPVLEKIVF